MKITRKNYASLLVIVALNLCLQAQISVVKLDNNWELLVEGKPFIVKGVTFGFDKDIANYNTYFKDLNFLGVNTIRTWATGDNSIKLLDAAHANNIKVMLGIWMRHGRPGMEDDDSFNYLENADGKEEMYKNAINVVKTYKDHPALLTWGIGNEVYLNTATDEEKIAYSKLLERICTAIKKIDPNHPTTSVEAWTFGMDWWQKHVPSLDIYGLNSYGHGAALLSNELQKRKIDKPYILTEFGVTGEWDIKQEVNGVKLEPSDTDKYKAIVNGTENWILNKPENLGVFVFHYATGKKFIAPWLFTHYKHKTRPQYWAIREAFTGKKPLNNVPQIKTFNLESDTEDSGKWIPVNLNVTDIENDSLQFSFSYNQRTGSRNRRDQLLALEYSGNLKEGFKIRLPKVHGPVKIYVEVSDSYNNMAIASSGIRVNDETEKNRKYLVPKVTVPFYVYKDGIENNYAASAYMGNYKKMHVDLKSNEDVFSGTSSLKISYNDDYDWYGLGLVNPANDWGDILGGYDISGAKKFTFWAKANKKDVIATIGFGMIGKEKPFPDTAKKSVEVKLTTKWKRYSISTRKLDLTCIRSGFTIFSIGNVGGQIIYIDDVIFE